MIRSLSFILLSAFYGSLTFANFPTGHFVGTLQSTSNQIEFSELFILRTGESDQYLALSFFATDSDTPPIAGGAFLGEELRPGTLTLKRLYPSPNWPTFQTTEEHRLTLAVQRIPVRGGIELEQIEVHSRPHEMSWILERPQDAQASRVLPFRNSMNFNGVLKAPDFNVENFRPYETRASLNHTAEEVSLSLRYGSNLDSLPSFRSFANNLIGSFNLAQNERDETSFLTPYTGNTAEHLRLKHITRTLMGAYSVSSDAHSPTGVHLGGSPYGLVVAIRTRSFGRNSNTLRGSVRSRVQLRILTFPYELMGTLERYSNITESGLNQYRTDLNWSPVIVFEEQ